MARQSERVTKTRSISQRNYDHFFHHVLSLVPTLPENFLPRPCYCVFDSPQSHASGCCQWHLWRRSLQRRFDQTVVASRDRAADQVAKSIWRACFPVHGPRRRYACAILQEFRCAGEHPWREQASSSIVAALVRCGKPRRRGKHHLQAQPGVVA